MASKAILFEASGLHAPSRPRLGARTIDLLLMLAAALALRCWWFGDPVVQVDEQFYLMVGDRLLHGSLPFVDIWDRKPIGLFLIYAGVRLLGGGGIVEYQLVATACAAASAFLIVRMARGFAGEGAARLAGLVSLLWLIVFDGAGGQAPIFYNPLVAAAAMLTLRAFRSEDGARIGRCGAGAMALVGLAIQIKYTALFEGIGFGLMLLWSGRRTQMRLPRLAGLALLWVALALAPTLIALAVYADLGAARGFFYANFLSVGARAPVAGRILAKRLAYIVAEALPLIVAIGWGMRAPAADAEALRVRRFALLWLAGALVGFCSIGVFYTHYALPVVVPLSLAAAPAFDRLTARGWRPALLLLPVGVLLAAGLSIVRVHKRGDGHEVQAMAAAIRPRLTGCLFIFDGEPILYQLTHACLATRYAFPSHLSEQKEARAIGVDPVREVEHALDLRPAMIVTSDRPAKDGNPATWAAVRRRLGHDYALVAAVPVHHRVRLIYQRS